MTLLIATLFRIVLVWLTELYLNLQLSLLTLLLAILLAIPLAVFLRYHEKLAYWVLQIAGVFPRPSSLGLCWGSIPF